MAFRNIKHAITDIILKTTTIICQVVLWWTKNASAYHHFARQMVSLYSVYTVLSHDPVSACPAPFSKVLTCFCMWFILEQSCTAKTDLRINKYQDQIYQCWQKSCWQSEPQPIRQHCVMNTIWHRIRYKIWYIDGKINFFRPSKIIWRTIESILMSWLGQGWGSNICRKLQLLGSFEVILSSFIFTQALLLL